MTNESLEHIAASDPVMRRLIREVGPCTLVPETRRPPFQSLVQAVANQQLNNTAANAILTRFIKLFPGRRFPRPADIASVKDDALRAAGFSRAKVASIRDIAAKTLGGIVPTGRQIVRLTDDEIVARLTELRGVGRWTVEMLLIFQLGRPDVLPADDFGLRTGFRIAFNRRDLPTPKRRFLRTVNNGGLIAQRRPGISGGRWTLCRKRSDAVPRFGYQVSLVKSPNTN